MDSDKISKLHLYYILAICSLIIISILLQIRYPVSEVAFENFSFASTITSIVLAVVSIVYSIQSGNASNIQLNNVRDIDAEIKKQLEDFGHIEENLSKLLDGGISKIQKDVKSLNEGQLEISSLLNDFDKVKIVTSKKDSENNSMFTGGSAYGYILLYACSLSFNKNIDLPIRVFDENQSDYNYWLGFFVAIVAALPDKIQIEPNENESSPLASHISMFDEEFLGASSKIRGMLNRNLDNNSVLKEYLIKIENHFNHVSEAESIS